MKTKILILFLFFYSTIIKSQTERLESVQFACVHFGITTPYAISCNDFENDFKEFYSLKTINDTGLVCQLNSALKTVEFNIGNGDSINVRAKLYLKYENSNLVRTLCLNKFYDIELDGRCIVKNEILIYFLKNLFKDCQMQK